MTDRATVTERARGAARMLAAFCDLSESQEQECADVIESTCAEAVREERERRERAEQKLADAVYFHTNECKDRTAAEAKLVRAEQRVKELTEEVAAWKAAAKATVNALTPKGATRG